jgi:hypothetical protein
MKLDLTRRAFVGSLAVTAVSAAAADEGWVELFDGHSLEGLAAEREQGFMESGERPTRGGRAAVAPIL